MINFGSKSEKSPSTSFNSMTRECKTLLLLNISRWWRC